LHRERPVSETDPEIQSYGKNHPLLAPADGGSGGAFNHVDVEGYWGNLALVGHHDAMFGQAKINLTSRRPRLKICYSHAV
jgi:hypothetical protein